MYLAGVLRATSMLLLYVDRCNIYLAAVLRATSMLRAWHTWPQHVSCCLDTTCILLPQHVCWWHAHTWAEPGSRQSPQPHLAAQGKKK